MNDEGFQDGPEPRDTSQPSTSEDSQTKVSDKNEDVERGDGIRSFWKLKMRGVTDDLPQYV